MRISRHYAPRKLKLLAMREKSFDMFNEKRGIFTHFDTTEKYRYYCHPSRDTILKIDMKPKYNLFFQVMHLPLLIMYNVCQITENILTMLKITINNTHYICNIVKINAITKMSLWQKSKRNTFSWFSVIQFLLGNLMNLNEEFASSTEAEVTGSSKSSFRISVTLA